MYQICIAALLDHVVFSSATAWHQQRYNCASMLKCLLHALSKHDLQLQCVCTEIKAWDYVLNISADCWQDYLDENGSVVESVYELSCPVVEEQPGLLPAFLALLPSQNAEPGKAASLAKSHGLCPAYTFV